MCYEKGKEIYLFYFFFYVVSTHNTTDGGCIHKKSNPPGMYFFFSDLFITIHNEMSIWHRRKFSRGDE